MNEDFARELKDDDSVIKDVILIGSDGGRVPAAKAILAIRSPVFRRMFYGNFCESSSDCNSVKMDYPTSVLTNVVEYCYTSGTYDKKGSEVLSDELAVELVRILDAANYLELSELRKTTLHRVLESNSRWSNSCAIMQELMVRGGIGGELWSACMKRVEKVPRCCFFPGGPKTNSGICGISFPLLETIFQSLKDKLPADFAVRALKEWNETHDSVAEEERSRLQQLADAVDLKSMEIRDLAKVQPCPLFTKDRLYEAFVALGKKVERSNRKRVRT
jgi:hypothetical protein